MPAGGSIQKTRGKGLAVLAILVAIAGYFVWRQVSQGGFDARSFLAALAQLHWGWLAASSAVALSTFYVRALRWAVFNETLSPPPNIWKLTKSTAIGFAAITLLGRPGELIRPYLIARSHGLTVSSQIAALVLERVFDLLAALVIFGFGLSQVRSSGATVGDRLTWVLQIGGGLVVSLTVLCVGMLLMNVYYGDRFLRLGVWMVRHLPAAVHDRAEALLNSFFEGLRSTRSLGAILRILAFTALEWVLIVCTVVAVFRAFPSIPMSFLDVIIFCGFLAFGAVVQIPGIGGGVQVVTVLVLTEMFRVPLEIASSAALVLWLVTFVVVMPFGLGLAAKDGIQFTKLMRMKAEAV